MNSRDMERLAKEIEKSSSNVLENIRKNPQTVAKDIFFKAMENDFQSIFYLGCAVRISPIIERALNSNLFLPNERFSYIKALEYYWLWMYFKNSNFELSKSNRLKAREYKEKIKEGLSISMEKHDECSKAADFMSDIIDTGIELLEAADIHDREDVSCLGHSLHILYGVETEVNLNNKPGSMFFNIDDFKDSGETSDITSSVLGGYELNCQWDSLYKIGETKDIERTCVSMFTHSSKCATYIDSFADSFIKIWSSRFAAEG